MHTLYKLYQLVVCILLYYYYQSTTRRVRALVCKVCILYCTITYYYAYSSRVASCKVVAGPRGNTKSSPVLTIRSPKPAFAKNSAPQKIQHPNDHSNDMQMQLIDWKRKGCKVGAFCHLVNLVGMSGLLIHQFRRVSMWGIQGLHVFEFISISSCVWYKLAYCKPARSGGPNPFLSKHSTRTFSP